MRLDPALTRQLRALRAHGLLIAAAVVLAAILAYLGSGVLPRTYESRVTLLVGQSLAPNAPDFDQLLASQRLSQTYAHMATMRPIVTKVIDRLGLSETPEQLTSRVLAQSESDSLFLSITVQDGVPDQAALIANTFAEELLGASPSVLLVTRDSGGANLLHVVDPAIPASSPVSPRLLMNTALVAVLALIVVAGLVLFRDYRDDRLRSPADVVRAMSDLTVVGVIEPDEGDTPAPGELTTLTRPQSAIASAYRVMRTQLGFVHPGTELRTLLIASEDAAVGPADVAANLAIAFAQSGSRTVLVDADTRSPRIDAAFALPNETGLSSLLMSPQLVPIKLSRESADPNLRIITSGRPPTPPVELLTPPRIQRVFSALREECDVVIVSAPPFPDAERGQVLAACMDGVLLVVHAGQTTRRGLAGARESLWRAGANLVGIVVVQPARPGRGVTGRVRAAMDLSPGPRESS